MFSASSIKFAVRASRPLFTKASMMPCVSLSEQFPSIPATHPLAATAAKLTTSTTFSGLSLGSDDRDASVATIGVYLNTGARDETEDNAGVSQLFAKMAFRATLTRSDLRLYRDIEAIGGVINAQAGRDFVRYSISVLPHHLEAAAVILAETTLAPKFALYDVNEQKKVVQAEFEKITGDPSTLLIEGLHAAAFYDDMTLGRSLIATDNISALNPDTLWMYQSKYVNTSSAALVGAGVSHNTLTDLANAYFSSFAKGAEASSAAAKYVGGETRIKKASNLTHVALALPTVGRDSPDFGASQVLRALLCLRITSKNITAFLSSYSDAALIGLSGYATPAEAGNLIDLFASELKKIALSPATKEELSAAKATAALEALDMYNTRAGTIGRVGLIATTGFVSKSPSQLVEGVSAAKLQELAQMALKATPSVASIGKLSTVPHVDVIANKLQ
ncbi:mitochondrial-processing peptidase subunit [Plasmopara halstedii]|uniref:Mitochondrial-processing peptidase subunit n=1 Tax=Plasmopara halstedii TaxID=4781 RepID=A0A0P1A7B0_PLAHL|nr:mitochondrial-processing peptidase subunit [Plasmopara halstedii]CEG36370.1 mitochondrial-processing peptidase subunit [Plasmopara halstedii]|eukprot:XP_024572739.1 mitochondrial-processing peptidase subunit [Plasmopara halstedii]